MEAIETKTDTPTGLPGLITRAELAARLKLTERQIRNYERQGMPVHKLGNMRFYDLSEAVSFVRGELQPQPRKPRRPKAGGAP